jgi:hypothetical protein
MNKYIIHSIWYTKPRTTWDKNGEVIFGRMGESMVVGSITTSMPVYGVVENIEYKEDINEFYVHFKNGWLLTIPRGRDTEICYKKIADGRDVSGKTNKGRVQ